MEDLLYYIGLGVIITIALVGKARKKMETQANNNPLPPPEVFERAIQELQRAAQQLSNSTATPETTPQPMAKQPENIKYTYTDEAQSLETIIDEVAIAMEPTAPKRKNRTQTPQNANYKANKHAEANNAPQPATTEHKSVNGDSGNESAFDLREAVIYSELLKPKFEE